MGSLWWWNAGTPRAVKRSVFLTKVVSVAAPGTESYSCSEKECTISNNISHMKGQAYVDGGEGLHGELLTNVQVLQTWQVCPVELELACRCIGWA